MHRANIYSRFSLRNVIAINFVLVSPIGTTYLSTSLVRHLSEKARASLSSNCPRTKPNQRPGATDRGVHTMSHATDTCMCGYLEDYGLPAAGDVHAVGLPVGHVPVVRVDAEGFSGATEAVPDL